MHFITKIVVFFPEKKPEKSPRAFGLLGSGFGRAGPGKNGSGRAGFKARPEARPITSIFGGLPKVQILNLEAKIESKIYEI